MSTTEARWTDLYDRAETTLLEAIGAVAQIDPAETPAVCQERAAAVRQLAEALERVTTTRERSMASRQMLPV